MNVIERGTPIDLLEEKFVTWLQQQDEYALVLAMPRNQRRAAQRALADRLYQHMVVPNADNMDRRTARRLERMVTDQQRQEQRREETKQRKVEQALKTLAEAGLDLAGPMAEGEALAGGPEEPEPDVKLEDSPDFEDVHLEGELQEEGLVGFIEVDEVAQESGEEEGEEHATELD